MFSHSHFSLKVTLALVLILYTMVKSRCFCQPDGISQTLSVPDLVTIENFIITSLFTTSLHKDISFIDRKASFTYYFYYVVTLKLTLVLLAFSQKSTTSVGLRALNYFISIFVAYRGISTKFVTCC